MVGSFFLLASAAFATVTEKPSALHGVEKDFCGCKATETSTFEEVYTCMDPLIKAKTCTTYSLTDFITISVTADIVQESATVAGLPLSAKPNMCFMTYAWPVADSAKVTLKSIKWGKYSGTTFSAVSAPAPEVTDFETEGAANIVFTAYTGKQDVLCVDKPADATHIQVTIDGSTFDYTKPTHFNGVVYYKGSDITSDSVAPAAAAAFMVGAAALYMI